MSHYICKGGNCKTVSEKPSVCLEPSCVSRYKLLDECSCGNVRHHHSGHEHSHIHSSFDGSIHPVNFGFATGIGLGVSTFLLGIAGAYLGWGKDLILMLGSWYLGFDATFLGGVAGGLWAFIDGFIIGGAIAWLYNGISRMRQ